MGRRGLPKLNPTLDYSDYYDEIGRLPDDWEVSSLFTPDVPLEVELGSGKDCLSPLPLVFARIETFWHRDS